MSKPPQRLSFRFYSMMGCRQCRCPIAMPMLFARTMLSTRVDSHFFFRMRLSTGVNDAASFPNIR